MTTLTGGSTQTTILKNIYQDQLGVDPNSSDPAGMTLYNNQVFFRAYGGEFEDDTLITDGNEL
ncbi:MAG: hypothetical protein ACI9HK_000060 [Pirellulaceae bacterium]|jgi:hypothetical protein